MTLESAHDAKILVVDDEPTNVLLLERILAADGYRNVRSTTDARTVLGLYRSHEPDLILLDLLMPHLDGVAVLQQLQVEIPGDAYVPVLVLTADATAAAKLRVLGAGAHDFLTKPFEHVEVLLRMRNLLNTRRLHLALQAQNRSLEATVRDRTERLLVVDDERSVAEAVAEALGDDGHQADIAGNGAIALQLLDRHTYDLVISDTKMPVLDGESFYGELERRFPQLRGRIIFLTGDVLSREKREFVARSGAPFLMKPFDLDELRQTVQRTLAGTPSGG